MNIAESKIKDFETYCRITIDLHELSIGGKKYKRKAELSTIIKELEIDIRKALAREKDVKLAAIKERIAEDLIANYISRLSAN